MLDAKLKKQIDSIVKTNEKIEDLIKENETQAKKISSIEKVFDLSYVFFVIGLFILIISIFKAEQDSPSFFFSKEIKTKIKLVIEKKADMSVVKHIYNSKQIKKKGILSFFRKSNQTFYPGNTSLSQILNDLKVDYYTSKMKDSCYYKNLEDIIKLHNQINPFDKLETNQKFTFENIRKKLNQNYSIIQEDLNRIADELDNKNQLVNKYLDRSNFSYWISVVALGLTLIFSTVQIYQSRNSKKTNNEIKQQLVNHFSKKEEKKSSKTT